MLQLNITALLAAQSEAMRHFRPLHPLLIFYAWSPVVAEEPLWSLARGEGAAVPVLVGTVTNETNVFAGLIKGGISRAEYVAIVTDVFPLHIAGVLERYPADLLGNATFTCSLLATEFLFACANRKAFRGQPSPVYTYAFQHPMSFGRQWWGANWLCYNYTCHAGELPFVFGSAPLMGYSITAAERELIAVLHAYWGNFAWTGDPASGPFAVPSPWPTNSAASDKYLRITAESVTVQDGYRAAACDFLDKCY